MIDIAQLPHVTATLNILTLVALLFGFAFIRAGRRDLHRKAMLTAVAISVGFLVVYVYYHANSGLARFGGQGLIRPIYFSILVAHVIGAVVLVGLVPVTLVRALRQQFDRHKRIAPLTWGLWVYVAASGIVVYVMTVHLYPPIT